MRAVWRSLTAGLLVLGTVVVGLGPTLRAATALPECSTKNLRASVGGQDAGAGNIYTTLVLRNVGHGACVTRGYPGVSLVDSKGHQIGKAAVRVAAPTKLIVLQ